MGESKNGKPKSAFSTALHPVVAPLRGVPRREDATLS
jgi:hypothetical protein